MGYIGCSPALREISWSSPRSALYALILMYHPCRIDQDGEGVWIEIERNDYEKSGKVINRTHPSFAYRVGDTEYVYDLNAVFLGKEKSAIEISFVGSSHVTGGDADVLNHTPVSTVPAFTAFTVIVVLGLLVLVYARRRRHS